MAEIVCSHLSNQCIYVLKQAHETRINNYTKCESKLRNLLVIRGHFCWADNKRLMNTEYDTGNSIRGKEPQIHTQTNRGPNFDSHYWWMNCEDQSLIINGRTVKTKVSLSKEELWRPKSLSADKMIRYRQQQQNNMVLDNEEIQTFLSVNKDESKCLCVSGFFPFSRAFSSRTLCLLTYFENCICLCLPFHKAKVIICSQYRRI